MQAECFMRKLCSACCKTHELLHGHGKFGDGLVTALPEQQAVSSRLVGGGSGKATDASEDGFVLGKQRRALEQNAELSRKLCHQGGGAWRISSISYVIHLTSLGCRKRASDAPTWSPVAPTSSSSQVESRKWMSSWTEHAMLSYALLLWWHPELTCSCRPE